MIQDQRPAESLVLETSALRKNNNNPCQVGARRGALIRRKVMEKPRPQVSQVPTNPMYTDPFRQENPKPDPTLPQIGTEVATNPVQVSVPSNVGLGIRTSEMPPETVPEPPSPLESLPQVAESAAVTWERRFGQNWKE
jgi:hypothetical protein